MNPVIPSEEEIKKFIQDSNTPVVNEGLVAQLRVAVITALHYTPLGMCRQLAITYKQEKLEEVLTKKTIGWMIANCLMSSYSAMEQIMMDLAVFHENKVEEIQQAIKESSSEELLELIRVIDNYEHLRRVAGYKDPNEKLDKIRCFFEYGSCINVLHNLIEGDLLNKLRYLRDNDDSQS